MRRKLAVMIAVICLLAAGAAAQAEVWQTDDWIEAQTALYGSEANKLHNLELAVAALDGAVVSYGETFSFNETVGSRSREAGYLAATNGRGAYVVGGGVSQLATTLYLAVRESGYLAMEPYSTYNERFTEWYVEDGSDAIITDYSSGKDFAFTSWYDGVIYISAGMDEDHVYCTLEFSDGAEWESSEDVYAEYMTWTPVYGSTNKLHNLELAVAALDGAVVSYGETFSFNETVGPRSREAGYLAATNGRGAYVVGGGVSQLATTLYLAVRDCSELVMEPYSTYNERFVDGYVEDGSDAIITDYSSGKDFAFTSWYEGEIYISAWMAEDYVYCQLELRGGDWVNSWDEGWHADESDELEASASTPVYGSENKQGNIRLAAMKIDGTTLWTGDKFSFNRLVGPRTMEAGFSSALNGRGVKVVGGGVAQVASTIYLAVKELDCVAVDRIQTYGDRFTDGYVDDPADAVVTDYNAGTDFSFTYWGDGALTVFVYEENGLLICEIYEE